MNAILDPEKLAERADSLDGLARNGFRLAYVALDPTDPPLFATLDVEFVNARALAPLPPREAFLVEGGVRRKRSAVRVSAVAAVAGEPTRLRLTLEPVGDYSTYTLSTRVGSLVAPANALPRAIDPVFNALQFKFRPGCFNLACAPIGSGPPPADSAPAIDYLARDYDSFRHVLMGAMAARVRGWAPTSEADLDQVLIDLIAARGDELADAHDRVLAERAIASARKRVSLARHARLVDYHVHQGQQATATLVIETLAGPPADLPPAPAIAWTVCSGRSWDAADAVVFATFADRPRWRRRVFAELNRLRLYTWGGTVTALARGATSADLTLLVDPPGPGVLSQARALRLRDLLRGVAVEQQGAPAEVDARVDRLVLAEMLNPATGTPNGRRLDRRQLLTLVPGADRAEALQDPVTGDWFCRVRWADADALASNFCFVADCGGAPKDDVSLFFANLAQVAHGRPHQTIFVAPGAHAVLPANPPVVATDTGAWAPLTRPRGSATAPVGAIARAPSDPTIAPLAYRPSAADGSEPARSTLVVDVTVAGATRRWQERIDLIESNGSEEHFVVETDENQVSRLRFGDGVNGAPLPAGARVSCRYQSGQGEAGNVGADRLVGSSVPVRAVWNPFDIRNGREPEARDDIVRRAPEAYRVVQKRAVTLADYAAAAERIAGVSHARARYAWCGSWRAAQVVIDPVGGGDLGVELVDRLENALDALRLIGDDVEIRPAAYVPLDVELVLCAGPGYWIEDLRAELEAEFSDAWTSDGRRGFFHPDAWTFGQSLHASQVIGRALAVQGIERALQLSMRRFNPGADGGLVTVTFAPGDLPTAQVATLPIGPFEILVVANDPDRLERGRIVFDIRGGRK
ncbi:MAG: baseplate J/gp47 family protein [Caldimonas sp.]